MAGELVQARSVLALGQRLEIFFENNEEEISGYTSRVEDIVGDDLVVAMPLDERRVPVIPQVGENLYVLAAGDGCHYRFFSIHRGHGRHEGRIPAFKSAASFGLRSTLPRRFVWLIGTGKSMHRSVSPLWI